MRHQAIGKTALMLGVLFIAAASAEASPVRLDDVVALATVAGQSGRPSVDLRMRQSAGAGQQVASTRSAPAQDQKQSATPDVSSAPAPSTAAASLTGTEVAPQQPQGGNVETVDLGEIQGTVCDCGPIRIPGGFPKWPWLALGGIPFIFIHHGCDTQPCEQVPPCTVTPCSTTTTPEPATIFLLGTGFAALGASARRAYARRLVKTNNEATEV